MFEPDYSDAKQWKADDVAFIDIDLSTARTKPEEIGIAGRFLFVSLVAWDDKFARSATLVPGEAVLTLNEPQGNPIELNAGMSFEFGGVFDRAFIRNAAQAGKMIRLYYSVSTKIEPYSAELEVNQAVASNAAEPIADVAILTTATTLVLAANANRKSATISNLAVNGTVVRIGNDNTVGAAKGNEIPIGGSAVIEGTNDIYVYNPSAGTINIGVTYDEV